MVVSVNHLNTKSSLKRKSFCITKPNTTYSVSFATNKRVCISPSISRRNSAALYSCSSSDDNDDDSDSEAAYINNQKRAKKRALSCKRSASFTNIQLSHAVSKYSDVDEDEQNDKESTLKLSSDSISSATLKSDFDWRSHSSSLSTSSLFLGDSKISSRKSALEQDQAARNRCFDYLVGAIDEAWARYCDATTYVEDEAQTNYDYLPNTPASLGPSEYEDELESDAEASSNEELLGNSPQYREPQKDNEGELKGCFTVPKIYCSALYSSDAESRGDSSHYGPLRLQQLKDRLLKAKYFLQEYLDTLECRDAVTFWRRWDLVKYATIELVEDEDDDSIIESTVDDLEKGRFYQCF